MADLTEAQSTTPVQIIEEATGFIAKVDSLGRVLVAATVTGSATGVSKIEDGVTSGRYAKVDAAGNLNVISPPPSAPPSTTPATFSSQSAIAGGVTTDTHYVITTAKTLTIQRFSAGAQGYSAGGGGGVDGSKIEIFYDPLGTGVGMTLIDVIYAKSSSAKFDENFVTGVGDGTRRIKLRRVNYGGSAVEIFGKWDGYEA